MDSGPDGDSFLAPRMLPAPDEGGDYQWPTNRMHCMLSLFLLSSELSFYSYPSDSHPHWPFFVVLGGLPNGPESFIRCRYIRGTVHA